MLQDLVPHIAFCQSLDRARSSCLQVLCQPFIGAGVYAARQLCLWLSAAFVVYGKMWQRAGGAVIGPACAGIGVDMHYIFSGASLQ